MSELRDTRIDTLEALHHDHYTLDELADLLEMDRRVIEHAAFTGDLKASIVDHRIVDILRHDVLTWLTERNA